VHVEKILHYCTEVDCSKIISIVSDNAANMVKGRQLAIQKPELSHVFEIRCYMHAFGLVMGGAVSHAWAKQIIAKTQQIVNYFQASHQPSDKLKEFSADLNIKTTIKSSNSTRLTSVYICLHSVHTLHAAFMSIVAKCPETVSRREVLDLLKDKQFWMNLEKMVAFLKPFSDCVVNIQSSVANMADVTRYWIYLSNAIENNESETPQEYHEHVISMFRLRSLEMSSAIGRLALCLDPRYRTVAYHNAGALNTLLLCAANIFKKRKRGIGKGQTLMKQLLNYLNNTDPFPSYSFGGYNFDVITWWKSLDPEQTGELQWLVEYLYCIVPHAAAPERTFSLMGWVQSKQRNRLGTEKLTMITALQLDSHAKKEKHAKKIQSVEIDDVAEITSSNSDDDTTDDIEDAYMDDEVLVNSISNAFDANDIEPVQPMISEDIAENVSDFNTHKVHRYAGIDYSKIITLQHTTVAFTKRKRVELDDEDDFNVGDLVKEFVPNNNNRS
jgi:hypothetical protein